MYGHVRTGISLVQSFVNWTLKQGGWQGQMMHYSWCYWRMHFTPCKLTPSVCTALSAILCGTLVHTNLSQPQDLIRWHMGCFFATEIKKGYVWGSQPLCLTCLWLNQFTHHYLYYQLLVHLQTGRQGRHPGQPARVRPQSVLSKKLSHFLNQMMYNCFGNNVWHAWL